MMSQPFAISLLSGVALLTLSGCGLFGKNKPVAVIAIPQETVPEYLDADEPAPFSGWLFSDELVNELAPAIRDHYDPPADEPPQWEPTDPPTGSIPLGGSLDALDALDAPQPGALSRGGHAISEFPEPVQTPVIREEENHVPYITRQIRVEPAI